MGKEMCMVAIKWAENVDPTGYWMSEKLDGVRAIRVRGGRDLISREGNLLNAPKWWLAGLAPDIFLDGELWMGRGKFEAVRKAVQRSEPLDSEWENIRFHVIEPMMGWMKGSEIMRSIAQVTCRGRDDLQAFYDRVIEAGGEGVVLRHPKASYHAGYSPYLLKVKPEVKGIAKVIGYEPGPPIASLDYKLTALECEWRIGVEGNRVTFKISNGLTEKMRANPPAIGSEVKFVYQCMNDSGKPRMARLSK
jgi:DNA ligase 1